MELQKLKDLSTELLENHKMFEDLDKRIEEKRNKIKEDIASLEKQLAEVDKEKEEETTKLRKTYQKILEIFTPFLNEANKYGFYNIAELGGALAYLATKITGKKHTFDVRKKDDFICLNNLGVYYTAEEAFLENTEANISDKYFAFAKSKAPDVSSIYYGRHESGCVYGFSTRFSQSDLVMSYDPYTNKYRPIYSTDEQNDYPFVEDFLNYVSVYRLNNNLKVINYAQLKYLADSFLRENAEKYKHLENNLSRTK